MNSLITLLGPTGVGKTELSLKVAERFGSPIISSDSRQLYCDLPIGTAAPTPEQQARVKHYFVGTLKLTDYYSASQFFDRRIGSAGSTSYDDPPCRYDGWIHDVYRCRLQGY